MNFKLFKVPSAYLVLTVWLAAAGSLEAKVGLPHKIDLEQRSFMLIAEVAVRQRDNSLVYYTAKEFHSSWQVRSRLDYRASGPLSHLLGWRGTVRATASEAYVFRSDMGLGSCERADHEQVNEALNLHFLDSLLPPLDLGVTIGFGRMLLFIEHHSSLFGLANVTNSTTSFNSYQADLDDNSTLTLSYDKNGSSLPLGVPPQVLVELGLNFKMVVKFLRVVPLTTPRGELIPSDSSVPNTNDGDDHLLFDLFAIERARGCSRVRKTSGDDEFLQRLAGKSGRFSFEARLKADRLARPLTVRVGYEPSLRSLRVERLMASRVTSTLVNYEVNLIYHVIRRRTTNDTVLDHILKVDQHNERRSCAVLQATPETGSAMGRHTIGDLLMGVVDTPISDSKTAYLGLARVRGIEAHAYEAHGTQLPAWLEQPSVYREGLQEEGGELKWRVGAAIGSKPAEPVMGQLTSVFYFSRSTADSNSKLLLIEVFPKNLPNSRQTLSIPIYDFTWQLRAAAPGGQRTEDFFSLSDECFGAGGHQLRVNLKLERYMATRAPATEDWLRLPVRRNLALVRAVRERFELAPPALMYDFESKYDASNSSILANMLMTPEPPPSQPIQLRYLGKALLRRLVARQFHPFWTLSFQVCYLVASHKQEDTLFAYNPVDSSCYTLRTQLVRDEPVETYFYFGPHHPLETYKIVHPHDDRTNPTKVDTRDKRLAESIGNHVILSDPGLDSPHLVQAHQVVVVQYVITQAEVKNSQHIDQKSVESSDGHLFRGLGLVAGTPPATNELVHAGWVSQVNPPGSQFTVTCHPMAMTFAQCHQACLLSAQCRAFSTCIVQGRLECVLTSGDLRAPELVATLTRFQASERVKPGQVFQVNASFSHPTVSGPTTSVALNLRRHPTCELHNKQYSRLFGVGEQQHSEGKLALINLRDYRLVTPVTRPELCAELCFRATVVAIERRQWAEAGIDAADPSHAHLLCGGYFHLTEQVLARANLTIGPDQLQVSQVEQAEHPPGYCLLDSDLAKQAGIGNVKQPQRLVVVNRKHRFEFDFRIFYEKTYGRYLIESHKTLGERKAYRTIAMSGSKGSDQSTSAFVERGDNTGQWVHAGSAAECARLCFTQAALVWPACRSFEFIEAIGSSFCAFNSVTMRELLALGRADMIWHEGQSIGALGSSELNEEDLLQVWHFDPIPSAPELTRGENPNETIEALPPTRFAVRHLKILGLFAIIYLVAMVGFMAGARLGSSRTTLDELLSRLRVMRGLRGDRDRDRLVTRQPPAATELDDIAERDASG